MSDSTKELGIVRGNGNFGAASMAGIYDQYKELSPSKQLKLVMGAELGWYDKKMVAKMLPERMATLTFDGSKGLPKISSMKPSDYFVPGSGVSGTTVAGTGLVPILIADTVMEGAMPLVCARDTLPIWNMASEMMTVPFFTARKYIPISAPGSDAYDLMENVGHATLKARRRTVKCSFGKELVKDAQMDIVSAGLKEMGGAIEMTVNQLAFSYVILNSNADTNMATDALTSVFVLGQAKVDALGFLADTVVCNPGYWAEVMAKMVPAYNVMAQKETETLAAQNPLVYGGLKWRRLGVTLDTAITSKLWTYPTSGKNGAVIFDSTRVGVLGIREDMIAEQFDDVTKYLQVPVLTSRFDFVSAIDENTAAVNNKGACYGINHA